MLRCFLFTVGIFLTLSFSAHTEPLMVPMITLSEADLHQGVALNTTWHFTGPDGRTFLVKAPHRWEKSYQQFLPKYGKGVYRLRLRLPAQTRKHNLRFYNELMAGTSFRLYFNDKLVGYNGLYLGSSSRISQFSVFEISRQEAEIRLEVENQTLHWSGLVRPLWLGYNDTISHKEHRRTLEFNIFFGAFFFLAVFHLVLYFFFPRDRSVLWFGLMTLSSVLYMEFFRMHNLEYLWGDISLEWNVRGLRLGLYWIVPCFFWYIHSLAPEKISRKGPLLLSGLAVLFSLSLILPGRINSPLMFLWFCLTALCTVYQLTLSWRLRHHQNIWLFNLSGLLFLLFIIHDILNILNVLTTGLIVRYGFLVFCMIQTGFVAWRAQHNHKQSEKLNRSLQDINANLENLVQERTEEIAEKNASLNELIQFKQEMVELLVHDLKTPLNVLLNLPAEARGDEALVQQASLRIKALVEHMLKVQHQEESELQLQLKTLPLAELMQQVTDVLQSWAHSKQVQLTNLIARDCQVRVDVFLFSRVIQNILDNAIKAAPTHSEIIMTHEISGETLCLCIRDQGPGIDPETLHQITDKYAHFGPQNEVLGSSGLGLYLSKQIVEAHHGTLAIESTPGTGTRVKIYLPYPTQSKPVNWNWSEQQRQQLKPCVQQLQTIDVFEISALKPLLKTLDTFSDPQITAWNHELKESIRAIDEERYQELIAQVAPHSDC